MCIARRCAERTLADQVGRLQVVHREVHTGEPAPRHLQVPGDGGPAGQDQGVELVAELGGRDHLDVGSIGGPESAAEPRLERPLGRRPVDPTDQGGAAELHPL